MSAEQGHGRDVRPGVPWEPESDADRRLWDALGTLPPEEPPAGLRAGFYRELRRRDARSRWWPADLAALARMLAPAALALVLGFGLGRVAAPPAPSSDPELGALRAEVSRLSRSVALAMLQDDSAAERLRGVTLVSQLGATDPEATRALLEAAANDPVTVVRGAALDALGPKLQEPVIAAGVERLLLAADSVLVQLSVADLIMRWGNDEQIAMLVEAAEARRLLPEVAAFVTDRVRRNSA